MSAKPPEPTVASILATAVATHGWTAYELSKRAGIDWNTAHLYLTDVEAPHLLTVLRIARALGVGLDELFGGLPLTLPEYTPRPYPGRVSPEEQSRRAGIITEMRARGKTWKKIGEAIGVTEARAWGMAQEMKKREGKS